MGHSLPDMPDLKITRRNLPHWMAEGVTYYVTFRLRQGSLSADEIVLVLDHIKAGRQRFYRLTAAWVMPDHVHIVLAPSDGLSLSAVMKGIKGVSARKINSCRGTSGPIWQDESWDRIVRDEDELHEKLNYMLLNSAKAGLTDDPWTYCGWFISE